MTKLVPSLELCTYLVFHEPSVDTGTLAMPLSEKLNRRFSVVVALWNFSL